MPPRLYLAHRSGVGWPRAGRAAGLDAAGAIAANERFHRQLTARCSDQRLAKLLDDLRSQLAGLELWSATQSELNAEAVRQHKAIVRAIAGATIGPP